MSVVKLNLDAVVCNTLRISSQAPLFGPPVSIKKQYCSPLFEEYPLPRQSHQGSTSSCGRCASCGSQRTEGFSQGTKRKHDQPRIVSIVPGIVQEFCVFGVVCSNTPSQYRCIAAGLGGGAASPCSLHCMAMRPVCL